MINRAIILFLFVGLSIQGISQAKETTGFLDKGKQQATISFSDMSSGDAYGAETHLRYGYFIVNKFEAGVDANFGVRDYGITYGSFGPFVKYHLIDNWVSPFAVVSTDFGLCDFTDNRSAHYMSGKLSWDKYFVGAGLGFYGLNDHWGFEASLGYQHENYIRRDDGATEKFIQQWSIPIKWRISYSF